MRSFGRTRVARALTLVVAAAALASLPTVTNEAAAAPRRPATPDCGTAVPKSTGGNWVCTFVDNFDGTSLSSKWVKLTTAQTGHGNRNECYTGSTNNVSVANGVLNLTVRKEAAPFTCSSPNGAYTTQYTGGMVSTYGKFSQTYGRFEIRAKFPAAKGAGLQSALWLWPNDPFKYGAWPMSGEIDIAEFYTQYPDRVIPYIHYWDGMQDPNVTNNYCMISDPEAFHTYLLEWTTTTLTIKYDGKTCIEDNWQPVGLTKPAPFDHPFFVNLTQALGITSNSRTESTPLPATMQVDYVRVWK